MRRSIISLGLAAVFVLIWPATALAATDPGLGAAGTFAVLGGNGTSLTNTGPSWITGAIGAGTAISGFPPGTAGPQHVNDSTYITAQTNLTAAYNNAAGQPNTADYSNVNLGGLTLGPGVYNQSTAPTLTGTLTLSGGGVYIFKEGSTLVTASGARVSLINGAQPCDIFWVVGSSATIATSTTFVGNIMATTSITMQTGATLNGRALARGAGTTLDTNRIIQPSGCPGGFTASFPAPGFVPPPVGNILPATLGVPWELIGSFPWLLVIGVGALLGATVMVVSTRRRRRRTS
ncbi:MAG TPA: ice-binding family protein [Candidatus Dormibacteraeota bacterium]|nr:ice-binding family protein [Candidatus Dormibacteraeota bacterium]